MPLQQIQLDQSIYRKQPQQGGRSPISQALGSQGGGAIGPNSFVEREKAKWAEEDKLRKMERDAGVQEAQEIGMRIRAGLEKEKADTLRMSAQNIAERKQREAEAARTKAKKESDIASMPEMAKNLWKFAMQMDEEGQKNIFSAAMKDSTMRRELEKQGLVKGDNFIQLGTEPTERSWAIEDGFLIDKKASVPTFFELPEKEKDRFDPSKVMETYDSDGNLYLLYDGKALTPSSKVPEPEKVGELTGKVIEAATKIANGSAMTGTPAWDEAFKNAITSVGEAMGLSAEEIESSSKLSGVKFGQASALAIQFQDAGYTPEMMTEEFKSQILKANPTLNAQTLNSAIDKFNSNYVPSAYTGTTELEEETKEEKAKRELNPKVKKALGGIGKALEVAKQHARGD